MRQMLKPLAFLLIAGFAITSCKKETKETAQNEISQEVLAQINNLGFSTAGVQKVDEGYLVEGDIILTPDRLKEIPTSPLLRIAGEEQYRTFNLVTGFPRVITVSSSGTVGASVSNAIDAAIKRYNDENLELTFSRVSSGGDINIKIINGGNYIASAGFPSGGDRKSTRLNSSH